MCTMPDLVPWQIGTAVVDFHAVVVEGLGADGAGMEVGGCL